jgi:hypothetical protein
VSEVVLAFLAGERRKQFPDPVPQLADGALRSLAEQGLDLGKYHLDRVQVRRIRRKIRQRRSGSLDRRPDPRHFVHREVVHDDNVVRRQGRYKKLLDILDENLTVHGAVDDQWCRDLVVPQRRNESRGFPMTVRRLCDQSVARQSG